jgi:putative transposase
MRCWFGFVFGLAVAHLKSRRHLLLENAALRHQLQVLSRNAKRPRWRTADRLFWVWLSLSWGRWRSVLRLAQPETVIHWHRQGFALFWRWKSRARAAGRKSLAPETIGLIRQLSQANPFWGAPRIHGEPLDIAASLCAVAVGKVTPLDGVCPMHLFAKSQRYSVHNPTPLPSTPLVFD